MPSEAHVTLVGHLARDPELSYTPSNMAICRLSIATESGYKDKKTTTWWRVTIFGKQAETSAKFLTKGKPVMVRGEPKLREYEKDGVKKQSLEVDADRITFLGGGERRAPTGDAPNWGPPKSAPAQDDDLPPF